MSESDAVVDASVAVKWYIPERDHEPARALRDAYLRGDFDLTAPALFPFEVVNALRYSGVLDADQVEVAGETLSQYGVDLVPFRRCGPVAPAARELDVSIYDASYLALAATVEGRLYTADERLVEATAGTDYAAHTASITAFDADGE